MILESKLSTEIASYIQARASTRLEKFDKEAEKLRKEVADQPVVLADLNAELSLKRVDEEAKFKPNVWLTDAAGRAKQISMVTHALKFTHTDAKGTSVYVQKQSGLSQLDKRYLSTSSLSEPFIDVVGNAAALDVANLLQLEVEGVSLISSIVQADTSPLVPFAENETQLAEWLDGFKEALADKELSSHKLSKQIYFPCSDNSYHLISPLYASSLTQALYQRIADSRYTDEAKAARKEKKNDKFSETKTVDYPNTAVQTFGGTKPQNVSLLNSGRGGKSFLLSCEPPVWGKRELPPVNHKNAFWHAYERKAWLTTRALKKFLLENVDKDSTKPIRDKRADLVDELIGILLQYATEVQSLKEYRGWSAGSKLSLAEQLWLDPYRSDLEFQQQREAKDWQQDISNQFASWLNHKLKDDKLVFKDVEYREWSKLLERKFALLKEDLEVLAE